MFTSELKLHTFFAQANHIGDDAFHDNLRTHSRIGQDALTQTCIVRSVLAWPLAGTQRYQFGTSAGL